MDKRYPRWQELFGGTSAIEALDLEEVKKELDARPDEARDLVVVGLGKEIAVEGWLGWCDVLKAQLKSAEDVRGRLVESVLSMVGVRGQYGE